MDKTYLMLEQHEDGYTFEYERSGATAEKALAEDYREYHKEFTIERTGTNRFLVTVKRKDGRIDRRHVTARVLTDRNSEGD